MFFLIGRLQFLLMVAFGMGMIAEIQDLQKMRNSGKESANEI